MRKVIFSINMTLDGCVDHTVISPDEELLDFFTELLDDVDTLLFGRVTYKLMESFWPTAPADPHATPSIIRFANKYNTKPKIVFSKTIEKAEWFNSRIERNNIVEEVIKLKQGTGGALFLEGISISQELMRHGLIDEYWLVEHPIILGNGRRLFDNLSERIHLTLVGTKKFSSGAVALHYLSEKV